MSIPIQTIHLFPIIDRHLIELLKSLSPDDWHRPTIAKKWTVKDIVAHLLDGNIRTLSLSRDQHTLTPSTPINNYSDLVSYLNELNALWVNAAKRISPELLVALHEQTGPQYCDYLKTLSPFDEAIFSVAWAGESVSKNWFHIAREYTEKFIHQQQIRDAVGKPGLVTRELFYPFIDTFMYALPYTYRNIVAEEGTTICITVTTETGGNWYLTNNGSSWELTKQTQQPVAANCVIDPETAWKLFSKGITPGEALEKVQITGDRDLALQALQMVSVMA